MDFEDDYTQHKYFTRIISYFNQINYLEHSRYLLLKHIFVQNVQNNLFSPRDFDEAELIPNLYLKLSYFDIQNESILLFDNFKQSIVIENGKIIFNKSIFNRFLKQQIFKDSDMTLLYVLFALDDLGEDQDEIYDDVKPRLLKKYNNDSAQQLTWNLQYRAVDGKEYDFQNISLDSYSQLTSLIILHPESRKQTKPDYFFQGFVYIFHEIIRDVIIKYSKSKTCILNKIIQHDTNITKPVPIKFVGDYQFLKMSSWKKLSNCLINCNNLFSLDVKKFYLLIETPLQYVKYNQHKKVTVAKHHNADYITEINQNNYDYFLNPDFSFAVNYLYNYCVLKLFNCIILVNNRSLKDESFKCTQGKDITETITKINNLYFNQSKSGDELNFSLDQWFRAKQEIQDESLKNQIINLSQAFNHIDPKTCSYPTVVYYTTNRYIHPSSSCSFTTTTFLIVSTDIKGALPETPKHNSTRYCYVFKLSKVPYINLNNGKILLPIGTSFKAVKEYIYKDNIEGYNNGIVFIICEVVGFKDFISKVLSLDFVNKYDTYPMLLEYRFIMDIGYKVSNTPLTNNDTTIYKNILPQDAFLAHKNSHQMMLRGLNTMLALHIYKTVYKICIPTVSLCIGKIQDNYELYLQSSKFINKKKLINDPTKILKTYLIACIMSNMNGYDLQYESFEDLIIKLGGCLHFDRFGTENKLFYHFSPKDHEIILLQDVFSAFLQSSTFPSNFCTTDFQKILPKASDVDTLFDNALNSFQPYKNFTEYLRPDTQPLKRCSKVPTATTQFVQRYKLFL